MTQLPPDEPNYLRTSSDAKDGLVKCPKCGATEIGLNINTGDLRCEFCRYEWSKAKVEEAFNLGGDLGDLTGTVLGASLEDIQAEAQNVLTFKCSACGAEVVIETASSTQARCHWCRNTLSINQQIPNGAVPDMILPFSVTKEDAQAKIERFVAKRKFFSNRKFREEFEPNNIMGVYLPYMVVDVNSQVQLSGQGEHKIRSYHVGSNDNKRLVYDADVYHVQRSFKLLIDDLTLESSVDKLDRTSSRNTNNIINSIMPFDIKNAVTYDSNYLRGFTSEKRDVNVNELAPKVHTQIQDIARYQANSTITYYDRGVRWEQEDIDIQGQRWLGAYLPVWLYSYYEKKGTGSERLHYVAVNGRTGETMGSVPLNHGKLFAVAAAIEAVAAVLAIVLL